MVALKPAEYADAVERVIACHHFDDISFQWLRADGTLLAWHRSGSEDAGHEES